MMEKAVIALLSTLNNVIARFLYLYIMISYPYLYSYPYSYHHPYPYSWGCFLVFLSLEKGFI